ncbi:MAG: hypothetical protein ABIH34_04310, partial [Nanoarchaeota archaeon]
SQLKQFSGSLTKQEGVLHLRKKSLEEKIEGKRDALRLARKESTKINLLLRDLTQSNQEHLDALKERQRDWQAYMEEQKKTSVQSFSREVDRQKSMLQTEMKEREQHLKMQIKGLLEEVRVQRRLLDEEERKLAPHLKPLQQDINHILGQLRSVDEETAKLLAPLESLKTQYHENQVRARALRSEAALFAKKQKQDHDELADLIAQEKGRFAQELQAITHDQEEYIKTLQAEQRALEKQRKGLLAQKSAMKKNYLEHDKQLHDEQAELRKALSEKRIRQGKIKEEITRLSHQLSKITDENQERFALITTEEREWNKRSKNLEKIERAKALEEFQREKRELHERRKEQEQAFAERRKVIEQQIKDYQEQWIGNQNARPSLTPMMEEIKKSREAILLLDDEQKRLEEPLASLKDHLLEEKEKNTELKQRYDAFMKQRRDAEIRVEQSLSSFKKEIKKEMLELERIEKEKEGTLKDKVEALDRQRKEALQRLQDKQKAETAIALEKEKELIHRQQDLVQEIAERQHAWNAIKGEREGLHAAYENVKAENHSLTMRIDELERGLNVHLEQERETLKQHIRDELSQGKRSLENLDQDHSERLAEEQRLIDTEIAEQEQRWKEELNELTGKITRLQQDIEEKEKEMSSLEEENKQLEVPLDDAKRSLREELARGKELRSKMMEKEHHASEEEELIEQEIREAAETLKGRQEETKKRLDAHRHTFENAKKQVHGRREQALAEGQREHDARRDAVQDTIKALEQQHEHHDHAVKDMQAHWQRMHGEKKLFEQMKDEAREENARLAREIAPDDKAFILHDGRRIRNIAQLRGAIDDMADDTFRQYVNEHKNDFAHWIKDVFDQESLASKLKDIKTKEECVDALSHGVIHNH